MIANCDTPFKQRYFTITFRPFTPQPGGLEFKPGQDYYFISLSPNKSQENAECATHHTKVVFKICCKNNIIHKCKFNLRLIKASWSKHSNLCINLCNFRFSLNRFKILLV